MVLSAEGSGEPGLGRGGGRRAPGSCGSLCPDCRARLEPRQRVTAPASPSLQPVASEAPWEPFGPAQRWGRAEGRGRANALFLPQKSPCVWGFCSSGCC